jgi:hypothetical protein
VIWEILPAIEDYEGDPGDEVVPVAILRVGPKTDERGHTIYESPRPTVLLFVSVLDGSRGARVVLADGLRVAVIARLALDGLYVVSRAPLGTPLGFSVYVWRAG